MKLNKTVLVLLSSHVLFFSALAQSPFNNLVSFQEREIKNYSIKDNFISRRAEITIGYTGVSVYASISGVTLPIVDDVVSISQVNYPQKYIRVPFAQGLDDVFGHYMVNLCGFRDDIIAKDNYKREYSVDGEFFVYK